MKINAAVTRVPGTFAFEILTLEDPRANEILVRMVATGICHTDLSAMDQILPSPLPIVLGHEGAGIVERVGSAVTKVIPGDHVVMTYDHCGTCPSCAAGEHTYCHDAVARCFGGSRPDGSSPLAHGAESIHGSFFGQSSLASHALCYERNVVKVRKDAPLVMLGPLACGIQTGVGAALNALAIREGSDFVVFGVGAVGLSAVMGAKIAGARRIIAVDISDERLALARELGATDTVNGLHEDPVERVHGLTPGGAMFSLDTSGVPRVMEQALSCLAPRGTCGWLAGVNPTLTVPVNPTFLLAGRKLRGIIEGDSHNPQVFINQMVDWFLDGRLPFDRLCKTYAFADLETALADCRSGKTIKPIVVF